MAAEGRFRVEPEALAGAAALLGGLTAGAGHFRMLRVDHLQGEPLRREGRAWRRRRRRHRHVQVQSLGIGQFPQYWPVVAGPVHRQTLHVVALGRFFLLDQRDGVGRFGAFGGPAIGGMLIAMHLPLQQLYVLAAAPLVISLIACVIMIRFADTAHGAEVGAPVLGH